MSQYLKLKKADLQRLLHERGLSQAGKKSELVSRLSTYKRPSSSSKSSDKNAKTLPLLPQNVQSEILKRTYKDNANAPFHEQLKDALSRGVIKKFAPTLVNVSFRNHPNREFEGDNLNLSKIFEELHKDCVSASPAKKIETIRLVRGHLLAHISCVTSLHMSITVYVYNPASNNLIHTLSMETANPFSFDKKNVIYKVVYRNNVEQYTDIFTIDNDANHEDLFPDMFLAVSWAKSLFGDKLVVNRDMIVDSTAKTKQVIAKKLKSIVKMK